MKPDAYFSWLSARLLDAADNAQREAGRESLSILKRDIPAERIETKRAVRASLLSFGSRKRTTFTLRFRRRFGRVAGTDTERLWRQTWRRNQSRIADAHRQHLTHHITGIH